MEDSIIDIPLYSPNDLVHGLLAAHCADETGHQAGQSCIKENDSVIFSPDHPLIDPFKKGQNTDINKYLIEWTVLKVIDDEQSGYCGVIYQNVKDKQLVLSQRSTNFALSLTTKNIIKQSGA